MVWASVRNMYMIISKFSPLLGCSKFRKCAKFPHYNLLLTSVRAKEQGYNRNRGGTIVRAMQGYAGQYIKVESYPLVTKVNVLYKMV